MQPLCGRLPLFFRSRLHPPPSSPAVRERKGAGGGGGVGAAPPGVLRSTGAEPGAARFHRFETTPAVSANVHCTISGDAISSLITSPGL
jgi:hypothetical protein